MTPERTRPLIAYALVALLCAVIVTLNLAGPVARLVTDTVAAPSPQAGPEVLLGQQLTPRSSGSPTLATGLLQAAVDHAASTPVRAASRTFSGSDTAARHTPPPRRHRATTHHATAAHPPAHRAHQPARQVTPPVVRPPTPPVRHGHGHASNPPVSPGHGRGHAPAALAAPASPPTGHRRGPALLPGSGHRTPGHGAHGHQHDPHR
ncbi:hypothetical protein [Nocardioides terrisoli]|uniref:hypothetical protein n=1 Tax=Nocardioides terrisoli TaxID=3388267 RepID=UPI00287B9A90|nr:hypothetical protein [Nocardioides marmorisolisilvae]